jgi:hypothetical protein
MAGRAPPLDLFKISRAYYRNLPLVFGSAKLSLNPQSHRFSFKDEIKGCLSPELDL